MSSRNCEKCEAVLVDNSKFCEKCGTPVATKGRKKRPEADNNKVKCKNCGVALSENAKFCEKCGTSAVVNIPVPDSPDIEVTPSQTVIIVEEPLVFASGLPEWDITPPEVVVRRKSRR